MPPVFGARRKVVVEEGFGTLEDLKFLSFIEGSLRRLSGVLSCVGARQGGSISEAIMMCMTFMQIL